VGQLCGQCAVAAAAARESSSRGSVTNSLTAFLWSVGPLACWLGLLLPTGIGGRFWTLFGSTSIRVPGAVG